MTPVQVEKTSPVICKKSVKTRSANKVIIASKHPMKSRKSSRTGKAPKKKVLRVTPSQRAVKQESEPELKRDLESEKTPMEMKEKLDEIFCAHILAGYMYIYMNENGP